MITRDLLNKNIEYDGVGYDDICSLVNRWKSILVNKYGAKHGQILTNAVIKLNLNHIAINIAAGELGMRLLIMDKPVDETTIHMTKMALFGPSDITIDCEQIRWHPHDKMFNNYSKIVIGEEEIDKSSGNVVVNVVLTRAVIEDIQEKTTEAPIPSLSAKGEGTTYAQAKNNAIAAAAKKAGEQMISLLNQQN
jgi:hypothetical protein